MGIATIDPQSHKVLTKLYKTLNFGVNRPNSKQDTAIRKCQSSVTKKCMAFLTLCEHSVRMALHQNWVFCESMCAFSDRVDQWLRHQVWQSS